MRTIAGLLLSGQKRGNSNHFSMVYSPSWGVAPLLLINLVTPYPSSLSWECDEKEGAMYKIAKMVPVTVIQNDNDPSLLLLLGATIVLLPLRLAALIFALDTNTAFAAAAAAFGSPFVPRGILP